MATPHECFHLTVEIVREIHAEAIATFGGSEGLRDLALLESAVAAPQATFGGESPFNDLAEVGAAYLFYLCRNHPFMDATSAPRSAHASFSCVSTVLNLSPMGLSG